MRDPIKLTPTMEKMINRHLGKRALAIQKGTPLGVWIIGANGKNEAAYVPINIFLRDMLTDFPEDEMAWFKNEVSQFDPNTEVLIMLIINESEQGVIRYQIQEA